MCALRAGDTKAVNKKHNKCDESITQLAEGDQFSGEQKWEKGKGLASLGERLGGPH